MVELSFVVVLSELVSVWCVCVWGKGNSTLDCGVHILDNGPHQGFGSFGHGARTHVHQCLHFWLWCSHISLVMVLR